MSTLIYDERRLGPISDIYLKYKEGKANYRESVEDLYLMDKNARSTRKRMYTLWEKEKIKAAKLEKKKGGASSVKKKAS